MRRWIPCIAFALAALCGPSIGVGAEKAAPLPFHEGSTTVVVLPDTEVYAGKRPHIFKAMMRWVAENRDARNIAYLLHVGDVTNNNTEREWRNARAAFDIIEGKVPYVLAAGNHDYDHTPGRLTHMNEFFKVEVLKKWPTFGDVYEAGKLDNHYQFLEIHGRKWIVLSLEMGPRQEVIGWANKVLAEHKDRLAIILTHAYLYYGNERYNHLRGAQRASPYNFCGDGADGQLLWNQLVRKHPNVMMVICGHLASAYVGYRADEADYGNTVHQMLVDYEKMRGGYGFLRLLEFLPDRKSVQVRTYSPVTKGTNPKNPDLEEFTFELRTATREEPRPVPSVPTEPLPRGPVHRYSFDGKGGQGTVLADAAGHADGVVKGSARLDGKGQMVIPANKGGFGLLPPLVKSRKEVSVEVWVTPMADAYNWNAVFCFGHHRGDGLWYTFRTRTVHRAEICNDGHNEDIQRKGIPLKRGEPLHIVVTYDEDGADGQALLSCFRDGALCGRLRTGIRLSDLSFESGRLGPFAGRFEEFRVYDFALNEKQVLGSYQAGPDTLNLAADGAQRTRRPDGMPRLESSP